MRGHILGDPPKRDIPEVKPDEESGEHQFTTIVYPGEKLDPEEEQAIYNQFHIKVVYVNPGDEVKEVKIDPEEKARNTLRYAWGTAPDFSALLGTVAKAARDFTPSESGMIGAAINSRQSSPKTEYLRAFGNVLTEVHEFALTTSIMQAMAIVANVVINQTEVDVTYDDVRKALARLGGKCPENSDEK